MIRSGYCGDPKEAWPRGNKPIAFAFLEYYLFNGLLSMDRNRELMITQASYRLYQMLPSALDGCTAFFIAHVLASVYLPISTDFNQYFPDFACDDC